MSLLMDVLRKFSGNKVKKSAFVYPSLLKSKEKFDVKRKTLLIIILLLLVSSSIAYIIASQILLSETFYTSVDQSVEETVLNLRKEDKRVEIKDVEANNEQEIPTQADDKKESVQDNYIASVNSKTETGMDKLIEDIDKNSKNSITESKPKDEEKNNVASVNYSNLVFLADSYFKKGNLIKSMEYYEQALSIKQDDRIINNLIVVYTRLNLFNKIESLLNKHYNELFVYTYIIELSKKNQFDKAIEVINRFIHRDFKGYIHFAAGYIYELIGNFKKALENYKQSYKKNPANPYFAINYARLLEFTGRVKDAYKVYVSLSSMNLEFRLKKIVKERLNYYKYMGF